MRKITLLTAFLVLMVLAGPALAEKVVLLDFGLTSGGEVTMNWLSVIEGSPERTVEGGNYAIVVLDEEGEEISRTELFISFYMSGTLEEMDERDVLVRVPYREDAYVVSIEKGGSLIFHQVIGSVCNHDSECGDNENYASCPTDCPSGGRDNYCDSMEDGICDSDCAVSGDPADCRQPTGAAIAGEVGAPLELPLIPIGIAVVVIIAAAGAFLFFKKKKK